MTWLEAAERTALTLTKQFPLQIARHEAWQFVTGVAGTRIETVFPEYAQSHIEPSTASAIFDSLARLERGEPLSYVMGRSSFLDVEVVVDGRVLIPRPETEVLASAAIDWLRTRNLSRPRIVDLGTGSGCIAKALCAAFPEAYVVCVDISSDALAVAAENLSLCEKPTNAALVKGDWLSWLKPSASWDVIICNPPYIASEDLPLLEPMVSQWEPRLALDGGADGQQHIRIVLGQAVDHLAPCGLLALEMAEEQLPTAVERLATVNGIARWWAVEDLAGRQRFLLAEKAQD